MQNELTQLVALAESLGLKPADLTGPLDIHPDRLNNGGLAEIIGLALEDDDPEWVETAIQPTQD